MSRITTHVLDTALGRPASGLRVRLDRVGPGTTEEIASARTDAEGRVRDWGPESADRHTAPGQYRLVFETGEWFRAAGRESLYPRVVIHVELSGSEPHYHIPLLLAPFGYSTYRGT
jgi:5-hydroxyisourate hydrolase